MQGWSVRYPMRAGIKTRIRRHIRVTQDDVAELDPLAFVLNRKEHRAVTRVERPVRGNRGVLSARAHLRSATVFGVQVGLHHPFAKRFEHRNLEHIPLTRSTALDERRQHPGIRIHAGRNVGDRRADPTGYLGRTRDAHEPRLALHEQVVRLFLFILAAATVARNRNVDEPRVECGCLGGAESEALDGAGRKVLNEDVGLSNKRPQRCDSRLALEVEHDALFVAVDPHEVARLTVHGRVVRTGKITGVAFDFDDASAEVAELTGRERRGHGLLETDDGDAVEWAGGGGARCACAGCACASHPRSFRRRMLFARSTTGLSIISPSSWVALPSSATTWVAQATCSFVGVKPATMASNWAG